MLVIGYSDFSANMNKYLETAAVSGLKILPRKKEKKLSARQRKFAKMIDKAYGIIPLDVDFDTAKTEAILKVWDSDEQKSVVKDFVNSPVKAVSPEEFLRAYWPNNLSCSLKTESTNPAVFLIDGWVILNQQIP